MKKFLSILCAILLLTSLLCGCDAAEEALEYGELVVDAMDAVNDPDGERTHTYDGVTLVLPNAFLDFTGKEEGQDYPFFFASDAIGLFGSKESKSELTASLGEYDLADYAQLISELNGLEAPTQKDGVWTVTYQADANGESQTFTVVYYETDTDFWMIQAYCATDIYGENQETIWNCLTGITFEDN